MGQEVAPELRRPVRLVEMVGAKGFKPAGSKCTVIVAGPVFYALSA
jgi:hypothetical protein